MTATVGVDPLARASGRIRALIRERMEDAEELGTSGDIPRAIAAELMDDPSFLEQAIRPALIAMTRAILGQLMASNRRLVLTGDTVSTRQQARHEAARLAAFRGWFESSARGLVRIDLMTRADLQHAAGLRRQQAGTSLKRALLLEALADRLGPEQVVGEVFDQEAIAALNAAIAASPDAPDFTQGIPS